MIARFWHATATRENAPRYIEHLQNDVLPQARLNTGFVDAYAFQRDLDGGGVEITVVSLWESMDAIRDFAGDDAEPAVVADAAKAVLISFDTTVTHHDVVFHAGDTK